MALVGWALAHAGNLAMTEDKNLVMTKHENSMGY